MPSRSSFCTATVTPGRRTASIMARNSCVRGNSGPSSRSSAMSNQRAKRSSTLLRPMRSVWPVRGNHGQRGAMIGGGSRFYRLPYIDHWRGCVDPGQRAECRPRRSCAVPFLSYPSAPENEQTTSIIWSLSREVPSSGVRFRTFLWNSLTSGGFDRSNARVSEATSHKKPAPIFAASVDDRAAPPGRFILEPRR